MQPNIWKTKKTLPCFRKLQRKKRLKQVSKDAGVSRESLYRSLTPKGKPRYETIVKVLDALGVQMIFSPKHKITD